MVDRICEVQEGDAEWVDEFTREIDTLTGLVLEMFESNPVVLLSPIFRELVVERAKRVQAMRRQVLNRLAVDNPGPPLRERSLSP